MSRQQSPRKGDSRPDDRPMCRTLEDSWDTLDTVDRGRLALIALLPTTTLDASRLLLDEDPEDLADRLGLIPGLLVVAGRHLKVAQPVRDFVLRRLRRPAAGMARVGRAEALPAEDPRFGAGCPGEEELRLAALRGPESDPSPALLFCLGERARRDGDLDKAASYLQEAYSRASSEGLALQDHVAASLAAAYAARGRSGCLPELAERAASRLGPDAPFSVALCHSAVGLTGLERGEWRRAGTAFRLAFSCFVDAPDPAGMVQELYHLGEWQFRQGEFAQAVPLYGAAVRLAGETGVLEGAAACGGLALCSGYLGHAEGARRWAEMGMGLAWRSTDRRVLASLFLVQGHVLLLDGDRDAARVFFDAALARALALGDRGRQTEAWEGLARIALLGGDLERSLTLSQKALAASGLGLFEPRALSICLLRIELALAEGRAADAERLLAHLSAALERSPNPDVAKQVERLRPMAAEAQASGRAPKASKRAQAGARIGRLPAGSTVR